MSNKVQTGCECENYVSIYVPRDEQPDPALYWVVVGEHNREVNEGTETTHVVELIYEHPEYNKDTNDNDLALLKMKEPIRFNEHVGPVSIDATPVLNDKDEPVCYVTGWGSTHSK